MALAAASIVGQSPTIELQTTEHLLGRKLACEAHQITGDGSSTTGTIKTKLKVVFNLLDSPVQSGGTPFTGRVRTTYLTGTPSAAGVYDLPITTSAAIGDGEVVNVLLFGTT